MNNKNELRPGIWLRAFAIGISVPVICVWGGITAGLVLLVVLWIAGAILDAAYFENVKKENQRKADEFNAELIEKLNKYK